MEWYVVGMKYTRQSAIRVLDQDVKSIEEGWDVIKEHYAEAEQWFIIDDQTGKEILVKVSC